MNKYMNKYIIYIHILLQSPFPTLLPINLNLSLLIKYMLARFRQTDEEGTKMRIKFKCRADIFE